ncbi:MAG: hypothetical protein K2X00_10855 [Nitrospiraceae bacterium]|nr:hypothetical protein [Nitrospiraceae bacterium]
MKKSGVSIPGYRMKQGKLVKIDKGSASRKIAARKSKRQRVVRRAV